MLAFYKSCGTKFADSGEWVAFDYSGGKSADGDMIFVKQLELIQQACLWKLSDVPIWR